MPSIKVYIWQRHGTFVGHASMELSDGTYISFWPRDPVSPTNPESPPFHPRDVAEDTSNEGGVSPQVCVIQTSEAILAAINAWWSGFKSSIYNFITNNCSTAVFLGLRAGYPFLSCLDGKLTAWVPIAAAMVAQGVPQGSGYFTQQTIQTIFDAAKKEAIELAKLNAGKKGGKYVQKKY